MFKLAAAQMAPVIGQPEQNLAALAAGIRAAAQAGARLVVFPEAAVTGYCFDSLAEALPSGEPVPGRSVDALTPLCRQHDIFAVYGTLEREGDRLFNTAVLLGPDGLIGKYRKTHLPYLGVDRFTTPGEGPLEVFDLGWVRLGMLICYDGGFPEPTRCLALAGADLVVLPTNWPSGAECIAGCVSNARAVENTIYFAAVNRVGTEAGFRFIGGSRICDPLGKTLAACDADQASLLLADIDPELARRKLLIRVPGKSVIDRLADRRPELYGRIVEPVTRPDSRQASTETASSIL